MDPETTMGTNKGNFKYITDARRDWFENTKNIREIKNITNKGDIDINNIWNTNREGLNTIKFIDNNTNTNTNTIDIDTFRDNSKNGFKFKNQICRECKDPLNQQKKG